MQAWKFDFRLVTKFANFALTYFVSFAISKQLNKKKELEKMQVVLIIDIPIHINIF